MTRRAATRARIYLSRVLISIRPTPDTSISQPIEPFILPSTRGYLDPVQSPRRRRRIPPRSRRQRRRLDFCHNATLSVDSPCKHLSLHLSCLAWSFAVDCLRENYRRSDDTADYEILSHKRAMNAAERRVGLRREGDDSETRACLKRTRIIERFIFELI